MLVVNLFGVPGAGKSTGAMYIASKLKLRGINAEYVDEAAKQVVWDDNLEKLRGDEQALIFGDQHHRLNRLLGKVDVAVSDSPLPLSVFYNQSEVLGDEFNTMVMRCYNKFDNLNFFVLRDKPYNPVGRYQTEEESNAMRVPMEAKLHSLGISYQLIKGNEADYNAVVEEVIHQLELC